jgi:hypothetical protein
MKGIMDNQIYVVVSRFAGVESILAAFTRKEDASDYIMNMSESDLKYSIIYIVSTPLDSSIGPN